MERDANKMRGTRPFVFTSLRHGKGLDALLPLIGEIGGVPALMSN